jgi:Raf kinase inhibitor-like YbhB/YbcL family protein
LPRSYVTRLTLCAGVAACAALPAAAQVKGKVGEYSDAAVTGHIVEPRLVQLADDKDLASRLKAPDGFKVSVFARGLVNPRMLALGPDGTLYATRRTVGDVIMIRDRDGDGTADEVKTVASRPNMHGIAISGDSVFLVTVHDVYTTKINPDGSFGELRRIINDLPDAGQHANRTIGVGPDGMLYVSAGSTCNECAEPNPENATILRAKPDGTGRAIFASHLRNTIGFAWEPDSGRLYGADHGIDWLGDEEQPEEFNLIEQGRNYGWPYIYAFSSFNPHMNPPEGITLADWAKMSTEPLLGYTAHSAPMQMAFVKDGNWPTEYSGDAFIAMRGSWNRRPPSGYEVARVDFERGQPVKIEPFLTGFLSEGADGFEILGRPTGLTVAPDGTMYVADDTGGIVYRVTPPGDTLKTAAIAAAVPNLVRPSAPADIAIRLVKPKTEGGVRVQAAFKPNEAMPVRFSADGDNASPEISWADAPAGARSFALIADDPDAAEPKPFTHWIVYDVPAGVTRLREGLATDPVLVDPKGVKQGANSYGSTGYYGMHPPVGDAPHTYHFQVFALDVPSLNLKPGAKRDDVLDAMKGHVLAAGEVVGTFERPAAK